MIPDQNRAVDFHKEYKSTENNIIMRFLTGGSYGLIHDSHLYPEYLTSNSIKISDGYAVKDDVIISVVESGGLGYHILDLTDPDNYIASSTNPTSNPLEFHGYWPSNYTAGRAYIVLEYTRVLSPSPAVASIKILKDPSDFDSTKYLFIGMCYFSAAATIINPVIIYDELLTPHLTRQVFNYQTPYDDDTARNADIQNSILNHEAESSAANWNKVVVTNWSTGAIELVDPEAVSGGTYSIVQTWTGTTITITHNYGRYPIVTAFEQSSGDEIFPIITHLDVNRFTVDLGIPGSPAYNFYITY